jgi:hypothetical protein
MKISAFDFMVGFQNYCNEKFKVIEKFNNSDNNAFSIFFKIFNHLYGSCEIDKFTHENINDFIDKILFTCKILLDVYENILPENINKKIFNKSAIIDFDKLLAENSLTVLFFSIIVNKDLEYKILFNHIKITIIFHLLCQKNFLKNLSENEFKSLQVYDNLKFEAGGNFIENKCKSILDKKEGIFNNINRDIMSSLIENNIKSLINEKTFISKNKTKKRRQLNMIDQILMSNYWNIRVSNSFLERKYSNEHITPFSSEWNYDLELDIDRLGNLFPTLGKINCERGNKDLSIYYKDENIEFTKFIKDLLPQDYNNIVCHGEKKKNSKPKINNIEKYNNYCKQNEELYKKLLLDNLFN